MRTYIEGIVDVIGDRHCGFRAIAEYVGLTEESHVMVQRALIKELKEHRNKYIKIYTSDKWLTLPDIGHIVASYYNRPVLEMTTLVIEVSETFFSHLEVGLWLTRKAT